MNTDDGNVSIKESADVTDNNHRKRAREGNELDNPKI